MSTSAWEYTRNPYGVLTLIDAARDRGVPIDAVLAGTGLTLEGLHSPDALVAAVEELAVARNLVRLVDDPVSLGVDAGRRVTLGMLGEWGFAMLNARTGREAIAIGDTYGFGRFSFVFSLPRVEEDAGTLRVVFDGSDLAEDVRHLFVERDAVGSLTIARLLFGPGLPIELRRRPGRVGLVFHRTVLDRPMPLADGIAHARWMQRCDADLTRRVGAGGRPSVTLRVRSAILHNLSQVPSLGDLAKAWHMDPRTLRRQLALDGITYREVVDEARRARAVELLESGSSVTSTAAELGYREVASFSRAFRRWTGCAPSASRVPDVSGSANTLS